LAQAGDEFGAPGEKRSWWDYAIVIAATAIFVTLGVRAVVPPIAMDLHWIAIMGIVMAISLGAGTWALWKRTRFS
jgi:hypothetical protein